MDYSPPGSSVHDILQAKILEWLPCPLPGDLSDPGIKPRSYLSPTLAGILCLLHWELQENICFCFTDYAKAFDYVDHNKLWKILKEMGIQGHLTCLLRNLYSGQETTVRTGHGTTNWFQIEKENVKAVYCHPGYLTYMQSTSWEMLGWMKH